MNALKIGAVYEVSHERKGNFRARVTAIDIKAEWIEVEIVSGTAHMASAGGDAAAGEHLSVRASLCKFVAVQP